LKIKRRPTPGVVAVVISTGGVPIRLTEERWFHIIEYHAELESFQNEVLLTVAKPDALYISPLGLKPNYAAVRVFSKLRERGLAKSLVVHYREVSRTDGFILTALVISDERLIRRFKLWQRLK